MENKIIRKLLWFIAIEKVWWGQHRLWRGPHQRSKSTRRRFLSGKMTGCLWPCAAAAIATTAATMGSGAGRKGWWLFRSKVRCPVEVVRHTRDILSFVFEDQETCNNNHIVKREQKMVHQFILLFLIFY